MVVYISFFLSFFLRKKKSKLLSDFMLLEVDVKTPSSCAETDSLDIYIYLIASHEKGLKYCELMCLGQLSFKIFLPSPNFFFYCLYFFNFFAYTMEILIYFLYFPKSQHS